MDSNHKELEIKRRIYTHFKEVLDPTNPPRLADIDYQLIIRLTVELCDEGLLEQVALFPHKDTYGSFMFLKTHLMRQHKTYDDYLVFSRKERRRASASAAITRVIGVLTLMGTITTAVIMYFDHRLNLRQESRQQIQDGLKKNEKQNTPTNPEPEKNINKPAPPNIVPNKLEKFTDSIHHNTSKVPDTSRVIKAPK